MLAVFIREIVWYMLWLCYVVVQANLSSKVASGQLNNELVKAPKS